MANQPQGIIEAAWMDDIRFEIINGIVHCWIDADGKTAQYRAPISLGEAGATRWAEAIGRHQTANLARKGGTVFRFPKQPIQRRH